MSRIWATLAAASLLGVLPVAAVQAAERDPMCARPAPRRAPKSITVPGLRYRTIQPAVCDVAPGGTVRIRPGSYGGAIRITKPVTLKGLVRGERRPILFVASPERVVPAERAQGVLNVVGGGGLTLSGVELRGGDAGIVSRDEGRTAVRSVNVVDVRISSSGRGVLHLSDSKLGLDKVVITDVIGNAVAAVGPPEGDVCGVTVAGSQLFGYGSVGVYIRHCFTVIDNTTVSNFHGGGLMAFATSVFVSNSTFSSNRYISMLFFNAFGSVTNSNITMTKEGPFPGDPQKSYLGDGIMAISSSTEPGAPSHVKILNNTIFDSARAAVSVFSGFAELGDTIMHNHAFALDVEHGPNGEPIGQIANLGGNECGPGGSPPCQLASSSLEPPAATPPP